MPWITGTQKIVIASATQHLITRTVSSNAPTVTLQAPTGGVTVTGRFAHRQLDRFRRGQRSADVLAGLQHGWRRNVESVVGANPVDDRDVGRRLLAGTTQGKFRVWVSDGVNTATDETDGVFTVPNKAPQINAVLPVSGTTYVVSQTIAFEADTYDIEDGVPPDDHIQWSSDLDGLLGNGALLQIDTLRVGTHTITLSVRDNQNTFTTTTFVIQVVPEVEEGNIASNIYLPLITKN